MKSLTIRVNDVDPYTLSIVATPEDDGVTVRINLGEEGRVGTPSFLPKLQFTFDNFIPLESNRFALAVAKAVAAKPGEDYSPLTLFGETGLGKTHLLHAIGNTILNVNPEAKVYCCDAPLFISQLLAAIRRNELNEFRRRPHAADVLLLDNFHGLAGKDRSQEELIDLLNTLIEARKQVVVTIGEHPKAVRHIDDRLKSILCGGLIADLQALEENDCRTFVEQESQRLGLCGALSAIMEFLDNHSGRHVSPRTMKGVLVKLKAYDKLNDESLIKDVIAEVLLSSF